MLGVNAAPCPLPDTLFSLAIPHGTSPCTRSFLPRTEGASCWESGLQEQCSPLECAGGKGLLVLGVWRVRCVAMCK